MILFQCFILKDLWFFGFDFEKKFQISNNEKFLHGYFIIYLMKGIVFKVSFPWTNLSLFSEKNLFYCLNVLFGIDLSHFVFFLINMFWFLWRLFLTLKFPVCLVYTLLRFVMDSATVCYVTVIMLHAVFRSENSCRILW